MLNLNDYELSDFDLEISSKSWCKKEKNSTIKFLKRITKLIYINPPRNQKGVLNEKQKLWYIELRNKSIKKIKLLQEEIKKRN